MSDKTQPVPEEMAVISAAGRTVRVPVPPHKIGFWRSFTLVVRGWLDAVPYACVPDAEHTNSTRRLMSHVQGWEQHVVKIGDDLHTQILTPLRRLAHLAGGTEEEELPVPQLEDLTKLSDAGQRAQWAHERRHAKAENRRQFQRRVQRESAQADVLEIEVAVIRLRHDLDAVRGAWRAHYDEMASRCTRSRTWWMIRRYRSGTPQIPPYQHITADWDVHDVISEAREGLYLPGIVGHADQ